MAVPLQLDEVDRRRLLMVRGLFRTAVSEAHAPLRSHRRIVALVGLDLATETLVKVVAALDEDLKPKERNFHEWLGLADAAVAKLSDGAISNLPHRNAIKTVHGARNAAQHDGWSPSEETLSEATHYTRNFLSAAVSLVWGRDIDSLSAGEAIETEQSRLRIQQAEKLLPSGDLLDAAREARMGLDWATARAKDLRFPHRDLLSSWNDLGMKGVGRQIDSLWRVVEKMLLGLEDAQETRLMRLTGSRIGPRSNNWREPADQIDLASAEWAVGYCTDAILTLEQRFGGSLDDPEG